MTLARVVTVGGWDAAVSGTSARRPGAEVWTGQELLHRASVRVVQRD
jgi:hypothetical protein